MGRGDPNYSGIPDAMNPARRDQIVILGLVQGTAAWRSRSPPWPWSSSPRARPDPLAGRERTPPRHLRPRPERFEHGYRVERHEAHAT